jgi:hypothetical protein
MIVVYKPEGATPREWKFEPTRLMSPEVESLERLTGMTFGNWMTAVTDGSFTAIHGLLYVMLKRSNPTLKWDEVQFCLDDIDFKWEAEEAKAMFKALADKAGTEPLNEEEVIIYDRLQAEGFGEEEEAPKASSDAPVEPQDETTDSPSTNESDTDTSSL